MQKDSGDSDLFTPVFKALSLSSALKKKKVILSPRSIFCQLGRVGFNVIKQISCYLIFSGKTLFWSFYVKQLSWKFCKVLEIAPEFSSSPCSSKKERNCEGMN